MCELKRKFKTVTEAEDALGITVETYMEDSPERGASLPDVSEKLSVSPALIGKMNSLTHSQISDLIVEGMTTLTKEKQDCVTILFDIMVSLLDQKDSSDVLDLLDKLYSWIACKKGISSNIRTFLHLSLDAMKRLEDNNKVNLVLKFCQGLAVDRPDKTGPLIPIHRMPFGLLQYCIEFFTCTNVMQVTNQFEIFQLRLMSFSWIYADSNP